MLMKTVVRSVGPAICSYCCFCCGAQGTVDGSSEALIKEGTTKAQTNGFRLGGRGRKRTTWYMKKTNIQKKSEDSSEHGSVYDNKKK